MVVNKAPIDKNKFSNPTDSGDRVKKEEMDKPLTTNRSALDIAKKRFKSGSLSDKNKARLEEIAREEIEKAGGDREVGLKRARERLRGIKDPTKQIKPQEKIVQQKKDKEPTGRQIGRELFEGVFDLKEEKEEKVVEDKVEVTEETDRQANNRLRNIIGQQGEGALSPADKQKATELGILKEEVAPEEEITTLQQFKQKGSTVEGLANFLQNSITDPATDIEIKGNRVTGVRNGERFEWTIDSAGNPIKKSLGAVDNEQSNFAKNKGIDFSVNDKGQTVFNPASLDEAIDLFSQFGPQVRLKKGAIETITSTAIWNTYSKYKGATTETYLEGLKNKEIAEDGETWNRLVKMNGGEPTAEMEEARKQFEVEMQTDSINKNNNELANALGEDAGLTTTSKEQEFRDVISNLDKAYFKTIEKLMTGIDEKFAELNKGSEKANELKNEAQDTADQIDDLVERKRKILKGVQKRFPQLPLSAQLRIAQNETETINEELFTLERQYNRQIADYRYQDTQDKALFEQGMKKLQLRQTLISQMYQTARGDLIRQEDIARADRRLEEQRTFTEQQRKQAIIDGDVALAKQLAYETALLKEKVKINNEFGLKTVGNRAFKWNKETADWEEVGPAGEDTTTTTTTTGTSFIATGNNNVTQDYGATSPVGADNVALADGTVGTPGVDIDGSIGDAIKSFSDGTVVAVQEVHESGGFGRRVVVKDSEGRVHAYSHLSGASVNVGDTVNRGQVIAAMGNTGTVVPGIGGDGSHLDYRVSDNGNFSLKGGNWIDPNQFMGRAGPSAVPDNMFGAKDQSQFIRAKNIATAAQIGEVKEVPKDVRGVVNNMQETIQDFKSQNKKGVNTFQRLKSVVSSKLSDKEQIDIFANAVTNGALEGDNAELDNAIKLLLLNDKVGGEDLQAAQSIVEATDKIRSVLGETGLTTAGLNAIARTVGESIGEDVTTVDQLTGKMLSSYIKQVSGAAVTDNEREFLAQQLPRVKDDPRKFLLMLNNFADSVRNERTVRSRQLLLNDTDFFNQLFPNLKFGDFAGQTNPTDNYINSLSGQTTTGAGITNPQADNYLDSLNLNP